VYMNGVNLCEIYSKLTVYNRLRDIL
jgi:hypothetical protein